MRSVTRFRTCQVARPARRVFAAAIVAALLPAVALAQGDSARTPKDSAGATHAAAGKRARLGALGRAAAAKASGAANKVEEKTGISKEAVAEAAIASTGVGAAAMMAKSATSATSATSSDSGAKSPAAPATGGRSVLQRLREARAAHAAGAAAGAAPATPRGATGSMSAQQMALYQQQMALAQSQAGTMPAGSAEMQRIQAEYLQLATRASAGDSVAARQVMRFSQEWGYAAMRVSSLAPDKQQAAYEAAMRDAMRCATTGAGCRAPRQ